MKMMKLFKHGDIMHIYSSEKKLKRTGIRILRKLQMIFLIVIQGQAGDNMGTIWRQRVTKSDKVFLTVLEVT